MIALAFDKGRAHRVLVLPAWFDEGNKLRHFTAEVMRRLDGSGIDSFLPDLPGCNESLAPLEQETLESWRAAAAEAARHFAATHVLAIRAGAMIAPDALPGWRYAPLAAASQLRALLRARVLSAREAGREENREPLLAEGRARGLDLGGYRLGATMIADLAEGELAPAPGQRDIAQGDLGGPGLWLRAEPDHDSKQADALAAIIAMELLSAPSVRGELVEPRPTQDKREEAHSSRRHFAFDCAGSTLAATLDEAPGSTGLLLVTGGNETRAGAFSSQAEASASSGARSAAASMRAAVSASGRRCTSASLAAAQLNSAAERRARPNASTALFASAGLVAPRAVWIARAALSAAGIPELSPRAPNGANRCAASPTRSTRRAGSAKSWATSCMNW